MFDGLKIQLLLLTYPECKAALGSDGTIGVDGSSKGWGNRDFAVTLNDVVKGKHTGGSNTFKK